MNGTSITHRRAIFLMIVAPLLWSIAGVFTRHLDNARGFEVTFWRSVFAALFVGCAIVWQERAKAVAKVRSMGVLGLLSGFMWSIMFCCFMIALTMTTVANTLVVMSIAPLLTAFLAWALLHQRIALRTWFSIAVAVAGMAGMFAGGMSAANARELAGMLIAFGVPVASAINVIAMKKAGHGVDLAPAVMLGGVLSALMMLPFAWPFQASMHDIALLATLGFFQLGFPCMLMVSASRALSAPEIALLALLEVLLGPIWAWLGAGEVPSQATIIGGAIVLFALVFNEAAALRRSITAGPEPA
jgi:drug/metabolite transporter (DMT)-like permease